MASIRPVVPPHYERPGKDSVETDEERVKGKNVWGRALLPVQAVRRTASSCHCPHSFFGYLLRLILDFEELSCPAASPRVNLPEPDAMKASARPRSGKSQAPFGRPGRARVPVPTPNLRPRRSALQPPTSEARLPTIPLLLSVSRKFFSGSTHLYPDVTCALHHQSAWELLVATILSAQSTDVRVNMVTPELFRKYPTVQDFAALTPEQLQPDVRSTGFFRNKSKSVVGAAKKIVSDFGGQVPDQMDELLSLPGVARKTANVVLGTWFKKNEGVVVDTHVHRIIAPPGTHPQ